MNISFIVPCFNCFNTLNETINSIYKDNFTIGDEIVLIDDASTDHTWLLLEELQQKFPEDIVLVRHNINKGSAAAARNSGIDISKNELIFTIDSDNILVPHSVNKLKTFLITKNLDAAAFGEIHYFMDKTEEVSHSWVLKNKIEFLDLIINPKLTPGGSGNYLFTKASWIDSGRYNESIGGAIDSLAFAIQQLGIGKKMECLEGTFYFHRFGYNSTYVKEINKKNPSLMLTSILFSFQHLIDRRDFEKLLSRKWREKWFHNKDKINWYSKRKKDQQKSGWLRFMSN